MATEGTRNPHNPRNPHSPQTPNVSTPPPDESTPTDEIATTDIKLMILKEKVKLMKSLLLECLFSFLYLAAVISKCFILVDSHIFYMNKNIQQLFLKENFKTTYSSSIEYSQIITITEFWDFMEKSFVSNLYSDSEPKKFKLGSTLFMGPPRLRQIRVRESQCELLHNFRTYFSTCYGDYSLENVDDSSIFQGSRYYTMAELKATPVEATLNYYFSGGYIHTLGMDLQTTTKIIQKLRKDHWIDRATKLILIELSLFNENIKTFDSLQFVLEMPSASGILPSYTFRAVSFYLGWNENEIFTLIINLFFLLMNICQTISKIREWHRKRLKNFCSNIGVICDMIIQIGFWICLIYEAWHYFYVRMLANEFRRHPDVFLSLDYLTAGYLFYKSTYAICLFTVILRTIKYFSLNKVLNEFMTLLKRSYTDLFGFFLLFGIFFITYSLLGLLLFGTDSQYFANVKSAFLTMIKVIVSLYDPRYETFSSELITTIYFFVYILVVFFLLMNVFLAILTVAYEDILTEVATGQLHMEHPLGPLLTRFFEDKCSCLFRDGILCYCFRSQAKKRYDILHLEMENRKQLIETHAEPLSELEDQNIFRFNLQSEDLRKLKRKMEFLTEAMNEMIGHMDQIVRAANERQKRAFKIDEISQ